MNSGVLHGTREKLNRKAEFFLQAWHKGERGLWINLIETMQMCKNCIRKMCTICTLMWTNSQFVGVSTQLLLLIDRKFIWIKIG